MPAQPDRTMTITAGGVNSTPFGTGQATRGSYQLPTIDGTQLTIEVSNDGSTWTTCPIEGNETNPATVASDKSYSFPVKAFSFRYTRLVMTTTQTLAKTIAVFSRD